MAQADFIFLACLRETENNILKYNPGSSISNQATGITLPSDMKNYITNLLGGTITFDDTDPLPIGFRSGYKDLERIDLAANEPNEFIFMFIDGNMLNNPKGDKKTKYADHWVQYIKGSYNQDDTNQVVKFKVFSWGQIREVEISFSNFSRYYYGSIGGKLP